jgi:FkbM family methyltransferase
VALLRSLSPADAQPDSIEEGIGISSWVSAYPANRRVATWRNSRRFGPIRALGKLCEPDDVVIDVGANIGNHSLYFARKVGLGGRVLSFEPQRILFQTLCANMALNSIVHVECFHTACGDKEGHVFMPDVCYDRKTNFGGIRANRSGKGEEVPLIALDTLGALPRLDLIKIDVEGMEFQVISGATQLIKRFQPFLFVENNKVNRSQALIELIRSLGYALYWCITPIFNPNNFAEEPRNIFWNIHVHNMLCVHKSHDISIDGLEEVTDPSIHPLGSPAR